MSFSSLEDIAQLPLARFGVAIFPLLFVPLIATRFRVPSAVGFIVTGVAIGPHALGVISEHGQIITFFADLGKLLLMFFVGLEIDLGQFRAHRSKSLIFGLTTFILPMACGTAIGLAFGYSTVASVLIGSLLASHTLIAYPMVEASGQISRLSVTVTVGATVLTDMLALLILAVCLTTHQTGFNLGALLLQIGELVAFVILIVGGLAWSGRWLFARLGRTEEAALTLLLAIVTIAAVGAEIIKLEGIIGAFLAGLAVNTVARESPAKEKLHAMGTTLFIPAFFVGTGCLIDVRVFAAALIHNAPLVIAVIAALLASKWLAAQAVGRLWRMSPVDRGLMGSLTMPQVAATLASALVGYQAINAAGVRLIDERMLNAILVVVVVTSVLGPVLTERYLRALAGERSKKAAPVAVSA